jgi:hypothetical protein
LTGYDYEFFPFCHYCSINLSIIRRRKEVSWIAAAISFYLS